MVRLPGEHVSRLRPFYEGRRVCVTGGAGFIGAHLVDALLSLGSTISVIDDLSNSTPEHVTSLVDLEPERIRFVRGSILDDAALGDAVRVQSDASSGPNSSGPASVVFHLAAMGSVPRSLVEPERCYDVNATGTVRVLEAARRAGVSRVVYSASSSAYGDGPTGSGGAEPRSEDQPPSPLSPYAASKLAGESACRAWSAAFGLSTVSLRYFNVFGPRQPADTAYAAVIASFIRRVLSGEPPIVYGDGLQSRDFTYVSNVVLANLLAGSASRPLAGEIVNIGTGKRVDLLELARVVASVCGAPNISVRHEPSRPGDVRHSLADLKRAQEILGYASVVDLREGLMETVNWFKGPGTAEKSATRSAGSERGG